MQIAFSNDGSYASVVSYDDQHFYMSFKSGSVCSMRKNGDGYEISNELGDCPEFNAGWKQLTFLTNTTDGSITSWYLGPDNVYWKLYTVEEVFGEGYEADSMQTYAAEALTCGVELSEVTYDDNLSNNSISFSDTYEANWYFNSYGFYSVVFQDKLGYTCPLIFDYDVNGGDPSVFVIDPWGSCPYTAEGYNSITFLEDGDDGQYLGPNGNILDFFESKEDNLPPNCGDSGAPEEESGSLTSPLILGSLILISSIMI